MRSKTRTTQRQGSRRITRAVAFGVSAALATSLLAACSSDDEESGTEGEGGGDNITLRIGVFGNIDPEGAGLLDEYEAANPGITVEQEVVGENADYIAQLRTRLSQNSGLADIQAIEIGNIAEMTNELSDRWVDFNEFENVDSSHFVDWKNAQATDPDGRLIGLGTDIGPTAICYRTDIFEQAGLPTNRDEVSALFTDWEAYLEAGRQFTENGPDGVAWADSPGGLFNAVVSAYEERYTNAEGEVFYQESEGVEAAWDVASRAAEEGLTTDYEQFTDDWNSGFPNGTFATLPACPAWMLAYIQSQHGDAGQGLWDIATSPAPSNWGGSFLGVPQASEHQEEAVALAAWLTAPEQQARLFTERGDYPSSETAQQMPEVLNATHPYFNDAPTGEIFSSSAAAIPTTSIGPRDQIVQEALTNGLVSMVQQGESADSAWDAVVSQLDEQLAE
jgi:cellobiose transport system substrate-binding protein